MYCDCSACVCVWQCVIRSVRPSSVARAKYEFKTYRIPPPASYRVYHVLLSLNIFILRFSSFLKYIIDCSWSRYFSARCSYERYSEYVLAPCPLPLSLHLSFEWSVLIEMTPSPLYSFLSLLSHSEIPYSRSVRDRNDCPPYRTPLSYSPLFR